MSAAYNGIFHEKERAVNLWNGIEHIHCGWIYFMLEGGTRIFNSPDTDIVPFHHTFDVESHITDNGSCRQILTSLARSCRTYIVWMARSSGFRAWKNWSLYRFISKYSGYWRWLFLVAATHDLVSALIFVGTTGSGPEQAHSCIKHRSLTSTFTFASMPFLL